MNKRIKILLTSLALIFGGLILFNTIKSAFLKHFFAHYEAPAVTVSTITVSRQSWQPHLTAVGNFVAINGVDINTQVGGNVVAIHFHSGEFVEKGAPLIDIDDSIEQATLKFNEADFALQQTNYKRQLDLIKRNATSFASVDDTKAKLLEAKANIEKTQALINQKHPTAPFSGTLGIRKINLGQYVKPGETGIVTLQSLDPLYLDFYLPEQQREQLHIGQAITFRVEQAPGIRFTGKITAINARIDSNTHTIQVQATVSNCPTQSSKEPDDHQLIAKEDIEQTGETLAICNTEINTQHHVKQFNFIPGMFAEIEIEQPPIEDVIVIPTTAISYTLYGNSVFVVEDQGKQDTHQQPILTVRRVFVTTGDQQGNETIVTQGLNAGDQIVSSGELKLQNGTRVTINNSIVLPNTTPNQLGH